MRKMTQSEKIYKIVSLIPEGKVTTYGNLARLTGIRSPRLVGRFLHKNPDPEKIPCHRVVNIKGQIAVGYAFGGAQEQAERLQAEGVEVGDNKVNLRKYLWEM